MIKDEQILILVLIGFWIFASCDSSIKLSDSEHKYLIELTESENFDYSFDNEGLLVNIYDSKIVGTNDISNFSPIIAKVFFRKVVAKKKSINAKGRIKLVYSNNNKESFASETKYADVVLLELLFKSFESIINDFDSNNIDNLINGISKNEIEALISVSKITAFNLYKYQVNKTNKKNQLYWSIYHGNDKVEYYQTTFNKSNKLTGIKRIK